MAWERPYFTAGGGDALLHFVLPGADARELVVSRSRHRVEAVPVELSATTASREATGLTAFLNGRVFAAGLREALGPGERAVLGADVATVVRGEFHDPASLGYLRDTLGVVAALLEAGGLAVLDSMAVQWWSPGTFAERIHARDDVGAFDHVAILGSDSDRGTWLHTRGLRKFGRPDLSVPDVDPSWKPAALEMLERLIWAQVRGHRIAEGEPIRMNGIPDGLACRHRGLMDDPDFNDVHVRIAREDPGVSQSS